MLVCTQAHTYTHTHANRIIFSDKSFYGGHYWFGLIKRMKNEIKQNQKIRTRAVGKKGKQ